MKYKETVVLRGYKPPLIMKYIPYTIKPFLKDTIENKYNISILDFNKNNSKSYFDNVLYAIEVLCETQEVLDDIIEEAEFKTKLSYDKTFYCTIKM